MASLNAPWGKRTIAPMKAGDGELPTGDDWVFELKWDGMRVVAFIDPSGIRLQSTNLLDVTVSFPEFDELPAGLPAFDTLILDGEVVALDDAGAPSFSRLQQRMHIKDRVEAKIRAARVPVMLVVFDVLHINGTDTLSLPWADRRKLLEQVVDNGPSWRVTSVYEDGGADLLDTVAEMGMEGLVAKHKSSTYQVGKRSRQWRKIKPRYRQELVVGGWTPGKGSRTGRIGSFDVGYWDNDGFRYAGRVGSGLTDQLIAEWMELLAGTERPDSPFIDPVPPKAGRQRTFVEPLYVIEVAFGEWSPDGHLRHPSYLGRRIDKDPSEVTREM